MSILDVNEQEWCLKNRIVMTLSIGTIEAKQLVR